MLLSRAADVYVTYTNTGKVDPSSGKFLVEPKYEASARSWRNCWNVSPSMLRSSGPRERRLRQGTYTDGSVVYTPVYDFKTGRNGMLPIAPLVEYIKQGFVSDKDKGRLMKRVKRGVPDVVREPTSGEDM